MHSLYRKAIVLIGILFCAQFSFAANQTSIAAQSHRMLPVKVRDNIN